MSMALHRVIDHLAKSWPFSAVIIFGGRDALSSNWSARTHILTCTIEPVDTFENKQTGDAPNSENLKM